MALRTISLCSGGGGLDLGLDAGARRAGLGGARAVCMVEGEAFAVATLAAQMEQGGLAPAPIWSDLRTFDARPWRGVVDCVTGGYPCQPFSLAGHRRGEDDPRHLWPAISRILRECEPAWCFFENVAGHLSLGGHDVIRELQAMGFRVACSLWTAEEVGAPHRRERLFILAAHPERILLRVEQGRGCGSDGPGEALAGEHGAQGAVADAEGIGWSARRLSIRAGKEYPVPPERSTNGGGAPLAHPERDPGPGDGGWWATEPDVGRVAHGVAARVERLRMLGNGVVPEQAAQAFIELYNALTQG
jgi:DNA (cytosine-5)-methyltransferase 1